MQVTKAYGKRILFIADTHFPYQHRDTFDFLDEIKNKYQINMVRSVGDLVDNHYPSYHELEPGTYDGETELRLARKYCGILQDMFPKLVISEGNHDALPLRKAKTARIPEGHIRDYNEVYQVGKGWKWVKHELIETAPREMILLTHSVGSNARTNAARFAHNSVQGHHHSEFGVHYYADKASLRWHMSVGCLINHDSPAMNYNAHGVYKRPILGSGVVINGAPQCIPMVLNARGRWIGRIT